MRKEPPYSEKLRAFRRLVTDAPPFSCGTVAVRTEDLILFYGKDEEARRMSLYNPLPKHVEHLAATCDIATFGIDDQNVLDESYRKAGKLDRTQFASSFDAVGSGLVRMACDELFEGTNAARPVKAELYKLNVYGPGSFFKPHRDTPRAQNMFGSLVVVFPTPHEGGSLVLRSDDGEQEDVLDFGSWLASKEEPTVAYAVFFGDVSHEVYEVTKGHRISLTYNLYYDDQPAMSTSAPSKLVAKKKTHFDEDIERLLTNLLDDPDFLTYSGTLGFGLRHSYALPKNSSEHEIACVLNVLKGTDSVIYRALVSRGLQPFLRFVYNCDGILVMCPDDSYDSDSDSEERVDFEHHLREHYGGYVIGYRDHLNNTDSDEEDVNFGWGDEWGSTDWVTWVTRMTEANHRTTKRFGHMGNEPGLQCAYVDLCMFVEVGFPESRTELRKRNWWPEDRRRKLWES